MHVITQRVESFRHPLYREVACIYRRRTNGEGRAERKRQTEDVESQRRQIPRARQNGESYRYPFIARSSCSPQRCPTMPVCKEILVQAKPVVTSRCSLGAEMDPEICLSLDRLDDGSWSIDFEEIIGKQRM